MKSILRNRDDSKKAKREEIHLVHEDIYCHQSHHHFHTQYKSQLKRKSNLLKRIKL